MTTEKKICPKCGGPLSKGENYLVEYAWDDYYYTYFYCKPCEQWYEELCWDRKSCGIVVTIEPVSKTHMEYSLAEKPTIDV